MKQSVNKLSPLIYRLFHLTPEIFVDKCDIHVHGIVLPIKKALTEKLIKCLRVVAVYHYTRPIPLSYDYPTPE